MENSIKQFRVYEKTTKYPDDFALHDFILKQLRSSV